MKRRNDGLIGINAAVVVVAAIWVIGSTSTPVSQAQETGTIAGWVYYGVPPYVYGVEGVIPSGQPAERGTVDEGDLPPPPVPPQQIQPDSRCVNCAPTVYPCCWPVPVEGALVAVQGTALSAT